MSAVLHIRAISHEMPAFVKCLQQRGIASRSLREMSESELLDYQVLLIEAHIDQRALLAWRDTLARFLDQGGTLIFNGHLVYPLIEGLQMFQVAAGRRERDLLVERVNEHPVFEGVDCADLSHRRGVAGFYARGANPPPNGAQVLHRLREDGAPIDWVWQRPQGGQIFMHSGNNLWMYVADKSSAARIAPQVINWALAGAPAFETEQE